MSAEKRLIGLKYCGGCKARYDRVAAAALIGARLGEGFQLVSHSHPGAAGYLVITGCPTACADLEPFRGKPQWLVTGPGDIEDAVEAIRRS